jgi:hypothetical protein
MTEHVMTAGIDDNWNRIATCTCGATVTADTVDDLALAIGNHILELDNQAGAATLTTIVTMLAFASIGAALRYTGWPRLAIALVTVTLFTIGVTLDARPPIRKD